MKNNLSMHTDADLENIVNASAGYDQQEVVEAAKQEIETRQLLKDKFSAYSTENLKYFLNSAKLHTRETRIATEEIKARSIPTHPKYEISFTSNTVRNRSNKYPALNSISIILHVSAVVIAIASVIAGVMSFDGRSPLSGLLCFVVGGILVLFLFAMKEMIKLFIDIEYNTRNNK